MIILPFILSFIIYLIGIFLLVLFDDEYSNYIISCTMNIILYIIGFTRINYNLLKLIDYHSRVLQKQKFIIVYNHISMLDGWVLWAVFGKLGHVFDKKTIMYMPYSEYICDKKIGCILIDRTSKNAKSTTDIILDTLKNTDKILTIAPDGMKYPTGYNNIGDFHTGAFVGKYPILPIIIKYKNCEVYPDFKFDDEEHFLHSFSKCFLNTNGIIDVDIMDMIIPEKNWSIHEYKDFVKEKMEKRYKDTSMK
jgi:1-acyl-sn-glycerol-3-phosphate acyltransferase